MARDYAADDFKTKIEATRHNIVIGGLAVVIGSGLYCMSSFSANLTPLAFAFVAGLLPTAALFSMALAAATHRWMENERKAESERRGGKPVLGMPPNRQAFQVALKDARDRGKNMIDRYLVGFELDSGEPIWVADDEIITHAAVFAKTGVGKTLWLEGLMFQQMARGRASGFTFIDAKRDPGTLADIIMMALITGRIEDIIVIDPFDPVCSYNFVFTTQRADVKARKVLRCGLPPTSDASTTKHYDRLAADAVYRVVRCMESLGLAWSVRDVAVALSAFTYAYPRMRDLLHEQGAKQAMVELGHLASSYRTAKGGLDSARLTDNLRGIASELHSIANSEAGEMFCVPRADLSLTDAILRGKLIYYMLPRLEEAESAGRMVKVFREDLEVSIGEITSSRTHHLEDPHLVIIDEGASTFGPTWANLFELARKGRFSLLFGAQSIGGLMDETMGLSEEFYERVIANVNLKVIMRLGDNRTAEDMCEWIGKVTTTKKSLSTAFSTSLSAREMTRHIEFNKKTADGFRDGYTVAEDEKDLVSAEELKHEMSAEKGLAWFDKGDGRLRKGRAIWFDADVPATWEGREFLTRFETVEGDEIGLAEWVDAHILSMERTDARKSIEGAGREEENSGPSSYAGPSRERPPEHQEAADEGGPFRLNLLKGFRGKGRSRTLVADSEPTPPQAGPVQAGPTQGGAAARPEESKPGPVTEPAREGTPPAQATTAAKPSGLRFGGNRGAAAPEPVSPAAAATPRPANGVDTNAGNGRSPAPAQNGVSQNAASQPRDASAQRSPLSNGAAPAGNDARELEPHNTRERGTQTGRNTSDKNAPDKSTAEKPLPAPGPYRAGGNSGMVFKKSTNEMPPPPSQALKPVVEPVPPVAQAPVAQPAPAKKDSPGSGLQFKPRGGMQFGDAKAGASSSAPGASTPEAEELSPAVPPVFGEETVKAVSSDDGESGEFEEEDEIDEAGDPGQRRKRKRRRRRRGKSANSEAGDPVPSVEAHKLH